MKTFEVKEKKYGIVTPSRQVQEEAQKIYMRTFHEALNPAEGPKGVLEGAMDNFLKIHGIWDEKKEAKIAELREEIRTLEKVFDTGGIALKEAEKIAYDIQQKRTDLMAETAYKKQYTDITVENQAEDAKFNYILSECLVDEEGNKVFASYEEFMKCEDADLAGTAALELTKIMYGDILEVFRQMPENKFLVDYGFLDEDLKKKDVEEKFKPFLDEEGKAVELNS